MSIDLTHRKAILNDLDRIIELLLEDKLAQTRETIFKEKWQPYIDAFHQINLDPQQYLMVVEAQELIVGTCHLTLMPSLTFQGATRMQIEAVRVCEKHRGQNIGHWMITEAIQYGKSMGASVIQLTTDKQRPRAIKFYEDLGFMTTHEGMKLHLR